MGRGNRRYHAVIARGAEDEHLPRPAQASTPVDGRPKLRDPAFLRLVKPVRRAGRTLLGDDRLWIIYQAARNTAHLGLPCAEIGAYRGGSAYFLASVLRHVHGEELPLHVVDTFGGHPQGQFTEHDHEGHVAGLFSQTSYTSVCDYLSPFARTHVHRGAFAEIVHELPDSRYGLAHIDVDVFKPMLESLRFFGPRLGVGGVLVLDDYGARKCPGVREAAEVFMADHEGFQAWHPFTEQLLLIKVR